MDKAFSTYPSEEVFYYMLFSPFYVEAYMSLLSKCNGLDKIAAIKPELLKTKCNFNDKESSKFEKIKERRFQN